jgi:hypothetical protein
VRRRREFSAATRRDAYERSGGICECHRAWQLPTFGTGCGQQLVFGQFFYEHIEPAAIGGLNDLDNCAVLTKTCWKLKTLTSDRPTIEKDRHLRDFARGIKSRLSRPIAGTLRSGIKIPMDRSEPVSRETGLPWRRS